MRSHEIWKGLVAGLAGGLAGAWAMNLTHTSIAGARKSQPPTQGEAEDATMKAAGKVVAITTRRQLTHEQKQAGGPIVHYAFGAAMGALFGAIVEGQAHPAKAAGPIFGAGLFLSADEIGVPLAGLSGPPTEYPLSTHLEALVAHLVYGTTTDLVRRAVRAAL